MIGPGAATFAGGSMKTSWMQSPDVFMLCIGRLIYYPASNAVWNKRDLSKKHHVHYIWVDGIMDLAA